MRILMNIIIIIIAAVIVYAFFMPWVTGKGSLVRPIDLITKPIQEVDVTHVTEGAVKLGTGVVDALTPIKLKETLTGFQIPLADNSEIRKLRPKVYLLYALPGIAILCAVLSIIIRRSKIVDFLMFIIVAGIYVAVSAQITSFNQKGLFVELQACDGYWIAVYSYLALSVVTFIKLFVPVRKRR